MVAMLWYGMVGVVRYGAIEAFYVIICNIITYYIVICYNKTFLLARCKKFRASGQ